MRRIEWPLLRFTSIERLLSHRASRTCRFLPGFELRRRGDEGTLCIGLARLMRVGVDSVANGLDLLR